MPARNPGVTRKQRAAGWTGVQPANGEAIGTLDHREMLLVAGVDPYAFKGTTDVMRPHIRPDGDGGCVR